MTIFWLLNDNFLVAKWQFLIVKWPIFDASMLETQLNKPSSSSQIAMLMQKVMVYDIAGTTILLWSWS